MSRVSRRRILVILFLLALLAAGGWLVAPSCLAEYYLYAARRSVEQYHNLEAQYHLQRCLALRPRLPRALLLVARVARRAGSFEGAEEALEQYQDLHGTDQELVLERVLLRAARGEVDEVSAFCQAHLAEDHPTAPLVREAVAAGLMQVFRLHEAEKVLHEWLESDPDNVQAAFLEGKLCELRLVLSEALKCYRRAIDLDPEHDEARLRMLNVLVQQSDGQEGLPHAEYLRQRIHDNPQVLLRQAQCLCLLGRQSEAREILNALLEREPHDALALAERGKLALQERDNNLAETMLSEAVSRDASALDARHLLAQALRRNGKAELAAAEQDKLARLEKDMQRIQMIVSVQMQQRPHDADLCREVGAISLRAGAALQGLRWLHRALEIDPNHTATHRTLADWYRRTGNSALAARHQRLAGARQQDKETGRKSDKETRRKEE
jgi:tetratricopeptide (TPR) repeat protein